MKLNVLILEVRKLAESFSEVLSEEGLSESNFKGKFNTWVYRSALTGAECQRLFGVFLKKLKNHQKEKIRQDKVRAEKARQLPVVRKFKETASLPLEPQPQVASQSKPVRPSRKETAFPVSLNDLPVIVATEGAVCVYWKRGSIFES